LLFSLLLQFGIFAQPLFLFFFWLQSPGQSIVALTLNGVPIVVKTRNLARILSVLHQAPAVRQFGVNDCDCICMQQ